MSAIPWATYQAVVKAGPRRELTDDEMWDLMDKPGQVATLPPDAEILVLDDGVRHMYFDTLAGLPGAGAVPAEYAIVGICPSTKRPAHRRLEPFGAASYKIISAIGRELSSLYVTNLVKEPMEPKDQPKLGQIRASLPSLLAELKIVQPRRVLALGSITAKALCPGFKELDEDHGTLFYNPELKAHVLPTYHFAAAQRNPIYWTYIYRDIERFAELPDPVPAPYTLLSPEQAWKLTFPENEVICIDLETTGLTAEDTIEMMGLSWGDDLEHLKHVIIQKPSRELIGRLGQQWKRKGCHLLGHNLPFDYAFLLRNSEPPIPRIPCHDSMLLAHVSGEDALSLKHLSSLHTNLPGSRAFGGYQDPAYLAEDLRATWHVYLKFHEAEETYAGQLVQDLVPVVATLQERGVYFDRARLGELTAISIEKANQLEGELEKMSGVHRNWNSPPQVVEFLQEQGVPLTAKTDSGAFSVAEAVLIELKEQMEHPALDLLLDYRAAAKLVTGFLLPYEEMLKRDGLLHPKLKLAGTVTGRLSCSDPNLQQVPRVGPIKTGFISRWEGGKIGLVDLSQAELRVAAYLSGDEALTDALLSSDVHRVIASKIHGKPEEEITSTERKHSKKVTFGILYGGSPAGLAQRAGLNENQVNDVLRKFAKEFPQLSGWLRDQKKLVETQPVSTTIFGRRRDLSSLIKTRGVRDAARKAVNTPIQSVASDLILLVLRNFYNQLLLSGLRSHPLFGVHDSLLVEVYPGELEQVAKLLGEAFLQIGESPLGDLPLFQRLPILGDFSSGPSWASVEETNEAYGPEFSVACSSLSG